MAFDAVTYAKSKKYTQDTAQEFGAVKGAPCTVESQTHDDENHVTNVVLKWENSQGAVQRTTVVVPDGVGIESIAKTDTSGLVDTYTITLTNNTTFVFTITNGKDGVDGKDGKDGVDGKDGKDGKDGTPIYPWQSGSTYAVGDFCVYEDYFYECVVANSDVTFDVTKWRKIGATDGDYSIIDNASFDETHPNDYLPQGYGAQERKMVYVVQTETFWLWNGVSWAEQLAKTITDAEIDSIVNH